jgi:flagellar basal-body rod protein FlgB
MDVFQLAEQRLAWTGQRQAVLAQNIANANTPGYGARDVQPFAAYLAGAGRRDGGPGAAKTDKVAAERSPDGNAVTLDQQLVKMAETDTDNQLAMTLYKKYVGLFRTAIGHG